METTEIIAKILLGKASDEEMRKLDAWLEEKKSHRKTYERLLEDRSLSNRMAIMETIDKDKGWKLLMRRIDKSEQQGKPSVAILSLIAKIAAAVLIVVAIGWAVFQRTIALFPII